MFCKFYADIIDKGMLLLAQTLLNRPVMSLRTGGRVATTVSAIINPNNLKIEGFYCQDSKNKKQQLILLYKDIRDVIPQGIAVNDHDVLSPPGELVRLKPVLELGFELLGKSVVTENKHRLGKVNDFAVEIETMYIQKIYVTQSVLKNITGGQLGVDRSQIIEITSRKIVIKEPLQPVVEKSEAPVTVPVAPA